MIQLKSQSLKNIVYFKDADLNFEANRITFVRGLNLDADPAQPTGNGAGKSLLLSCPSNVFYFAPPLAIKRKSKKELLGKGSSITQTLVANDGHTYEVVQTANKYTISKDGEDLGLRTVPLAEKFIQTKLFPITELVYYSTCYVSTQRPFRMQSDSDSDRLNHLSSMFQLDEYDTMKRYFLNKIGEIRESEMKLQVLERDLLEVRSKLKKLKRRDAGSSADSVTDLKKSRTQLEDSIAVYNKEVFETKTAISALTTLLTVEEELDALRSSYKSKQPPAKYSKYLKGQRSIARAWATYEELKASHDKTVRKTREKLDALDTPKLSAEEAKTQARKQRGIISELEEKLSDLREAERQHGRLKSAVKAALEDVEEYGYSADKGPDMDADYADRIAECRTTLRLIKLLDGHDHEDGRCPTCLSEVDVDDVRKLVDKAKKNLPKYEREKSAQSAWSAYKAAKKALSKSAFDPSEHEALESGISKAKSRREAATSALELWEKREALESALASVKKPRKPDEEVECGLSEDEIEDTIEMCDNICQHLAARTKLIENNSVLDGLRTANHVRGGITEKNERLIRLEKVLRGKKTDLEEVVTKLDEASSAQHEHEVYNARKKELIAKIEKLRPAIEDKRLLEVLAKAYSTKGLKILVADQICGLLEQNLNAYSNLIFNEPFVFSVNAHDGGMAITVDRHNGIVSDVRNLSGAESNAFRLLFVFSLLPLLPSEMRTNVLTLDEPCAHMDEVSRQKFLHLFLPALSEVVPNIYIITPNADDYCEGSEQLVVKKENGKSTVIKGTPMDLPHANVGELVEKITKSRKRKSKK